MDSVMAFGGGLFGRGLDWTGSLGYILVALEETRGRQPCTLQVSCHTMLCVTLKHSARAPSPPADPVGPHPISDC